MKSKIASSIAILSLLALATSCTKKNDLNPLLQLSGNIVSTRAQNTKQFIAIVKLKNEALLQSAKQQNGRPVVDAKALAAVNAEQESTIASLKALSADVQIVYRYKMVLNAVAVLAPIELEEKIKDLGLIAYQEGSFEKPITFELSNSIATPLFQNRNSSIFIGAAKLNAAGITGRGMKVGVIDTGIDYTHAMFKGEGTEEAYAAVNPDVANAGFPNQKVVGGIDLVGTNYDSGSPDFANHIPKPDMNPLDEAGHGTHVAGTVAGLGDGINTYNGMAPDAELHAIKVFGANGSTSDSVVIAALEYAVDPNGDGNAVDQLDIVNLSLGSGYGNPHILYAEAIKNLSEGGTVVVASAGNSGHTDYIVGAPGTSDAALSVAASVDNGDHLWRFNASRFNLGSETLLVEAIEAATTKKIAEAGNVSGKLVYIGLAAQDLTEEQKEALKGNVALIDRGQVNFNDKVKRAVSGGAIGVVVANNRDGAVISMGTTDKFEIPAIMITLADGNKIKAAMKSADITIDFKTDAKIEKPELIDTLTDFTSKGPRSIDGFIKPEISAPGENVISAAMGGGAKAVQMSGTSMAAPHMAGVMALVKQAHKDLTAAELKSVVMGTSKTLSEKDNRYSISLQGAGRIQADKAAESKIVVAEASISLGEISLESKKILRRQLNIRNLSKDQLNLNVVFEGNGFISMGAVDAVVLEANSSKTVSVNLTLDTAKMGDEKIREMDGWVKLMNGTEEVYRVPVLAIAHKLANLGAESLVVDSTSELDSAGAQATVTLKNNNKNSGEVLLFNLIGQDDRKPKADSFMTSDCDLQSAGYKFVSRKNSNGKEESILQVAVKLFKPMTTWNACDISVLIDTNNDGVPEQELLGSTLSSIPGQNSSEFATTLIDAAKAREIRKAFEQKLADAKGDQDKIAKLKGTENYSDALIDQKGMKVYNNSTVVVLEISADKLALTEDGALAFKVLVTHNEQSSVEFDDYLKSTVKSDMRISLRKEDQSFVDLPETIALAANSVKTVELTKGEGQEKLLVLMPDNKFSLSNLHEDSQSLILSPVYSGTK
ncbi:MAG: S8 family serine peptidase [Pseudobdellovibrio sp.]